MKKLDKLLLHSFITKFLLVFFVTIFILIIQLFFIWFDELAGKGLGLTIYGRLFFYIGAGSIPQAFPLAILVASLIMFGALGENSELIAIKAAGISLMRILYPLITLTTLLSVMLFFLHGYVTPKTREKMFNLLTNLRNKKPSLFIKEGTFCNHIPGYSIKINKKLEDGKNFEGIIIYKHTKKNGPSKEENNIMTTIADRGTIYTTLDEKYLIIELYHGHNYSEIIPSVDKTSQENNFSFYRSDFKKQKMIIDLETYTQQIHNLSHIADTKLNPALNKEITKRRIKLHNYQQEMCTKIINTLFTLSAISDSETLSLHTPENETINIIKIINYLTTTSTQNNSIASYVHKYIPTMLRTAIYNTNNTEYKLARYVQNVQNNQQTINNNEYEKYHRFALSFLCLIMLLLGTSIGVIVKKGGFGVPLLISSFFIMIRYVIDVFGKKWATELMICNGFYGAWFANFVLLPCCFFFLRHAYKGTNLFEIDFYTRLWKAIKKSFLRKELHYHD